ncbi:MAG: ImmA/IrrE family metallo-endopeptidase, partial [Oscillospiraceae bacterium]|nr:ImmA/IrrE family metallo-endopeptidase [Oscillospiraceae bacterium]
MKIAKCYGIDCKKNLRERMNGDSGEIILYQNQVYILVDKQASPTRQRYTVMHELGHYLLGHLGETPLSRSEHDCKPSEEQAADKFAIDMLAPACVLWGLRLHTPAVIPTVRRQVLT